MLTDNEIVGCLLFCAITFIAVWRIVLHIRRFRWEFRSLKRKDLGSNEQPVEKE